MDDRNRRAAAVIAEALDDGVDVAEFLAHALCTVAAKEGGIEEVLRNRSGSWEAGHVRNLMEGTVGPDGEGLDMYRAAEPETKGCDAELRRTQGGWRLEVRVPGRTLTGGWPTIEFSGRGTTVPTVTERNEALEELGYRPVDPESVGWNWIEAQEFPDDLANFIGVVKVCPLSDTNEES